MARSESDRVIIFDTTLRDAEQSPGASLTLRDKLEIAHQLARLRVDVIEAGFPISSNEDFEAVQRIGLEVEGPAICALARVIPKDIDRAGEALKDAARPRIHTFVGTSEAHLARQMRKSASDVFDMAVKAVTHARGYADDVEFSPMDATRAEFTYLAEIVQAALEAGASTINIPDTVGYAVPEQFGDLIRRLRAEVPNIDRAVISVHCHDDLGMAVSNSLASLQAGARQVECTLNGLGERAGNASLEEVVMALRTRADYFGLRTGVAAREILSTSRLVSRLMGIAVAPNKAIVGANAFAHEAGIHQDGVLKDAQTYEIMTPESVGLVQSTLVMGKHSGRHAFREKLRSLGYTELGDNALQEAFVRFKDLADKKKELFDEDIIALVDTEVAGANDRIRFGSLSVSCGSSGPQEASLTLAVDGEQAEARATGNGPVDAAFNAIKAIYPHEARLQLYQVHAVTEGTDAQAEVSVRLEENGRTVNGHSAHIDTIVASVLAYVHALNKLLVKRQKTAPEALSA